MRKLLVLLSVVLLFALCQSKVSNNKTKHDHPNKHCFYGYKKVNGTKECKTIDEFMRHPKNDTNCTHKKILKCLPVRNITVCRCVEKRRPPIIPIFNTTCQKGYIKRCRFDRQTNKEKCRCIRMGPVIRNKTEEIVCKEGYTKICKNHGSGEKCFCRKIHHVEPVYPPVEDY